MGTMESKELTTEPGGTGNEKEDHIMKTAIFQSGAGILGIGNDLQEAVSSANEFLDGGSQLTAEDMEVVYGGEDHGKCYYAMITPTLAAQVEAQGGDIVYVRSPDNILMTEEEHEAEA